MGKNVPKDALHTKSTRSTRTIKTHLSTPSPQTQERHQAEVDATKLQREILAI